MIVLDEEKLTYGTISMIGQDLGVEWEQISLEDYVDKVIEKLKQF